MGRFSIKGFVKFGQKEHLEALLNDGVIYMNNIDYFRKYEESQPEHMRGDRYECFDFISQHNTIIFLGETDLTIEDIAVFEDRESYRGYLWSMYAIFSDHSCFDSRMFDFGEYAVIIQDAKEFITRVQNYCKEKQLEPKCSHVKYYEEKTEQGRLNPFMKREKYSYQKEARIYIQSANPQEKLILNIGCLRDIAFLVKRIKVNGVDAFVRINEE